MSTPTQPEDSALPPLPEPLVMVAQFCGYWRETINVHAQPVFTEAQMRAYARAALAAPQQAGGEAEWTYDKNGSGKWERAAAEPSDDAKDAERYRWMKENPSAAYDLIGNEGTVIFWDFRIDAALASRKPQP